MSAHPKKPPQLILSCRETADLLRISERTLYTLTANGDLPAVRIGRRKCYTFATVEQFVKRKGGAS